MLPEIINNTVSPGLAFVKRSEQNGVSTYTGGYVNPNGTSTKGHLTVKHTRPKPGKRTKSSSVVTMVMTKLDAQGEIYDTIQSHFVISGTRFNEIEITQGYEVLANILSQPAIFSQVYGGSY